MTHSTRREFLGAAALGLPLLAGLPACRTTVEEQQVLKQAAKPVAPWFKISLAQWSLHRALRAKKLDNLDFAVRAREDYGLSAVEYVNSFFKTRARDEAYLGQMRKRARDVGVKSLLIMVDGEGSLAHEDGAERKTAIKNHRRWIDAAAFLGCHSIRVNAAGEGEPEEVQKRAADSLVQLAEYGSDAQMNVIVENHGGLSSNGAWLAGVMRLADHPRVGTLPDFGNFKLGGDAWYDRYLGVEELMPYAKAVSAKSHAFDAEGNETSSDYQRLMTTVRDAGYRGYVGIEYEGEGLSEHDGILATKRLLERVRTELA